MERKFDAPAYIDRIGERLVFEFEGAGQATTPSLVGGAREVPVREQLEQILPRGIAVGSGCVIDSYGNASQQTDVILYERDICPVFCVNNTPETTYYPCEGVIAVGEIKSSLNTTTLEDWERDIRKNCISKTSTSPHCNFSWKLRISSDWRKNDQISELR